MGISARSRTLRLAAFVATSGFVAFAAPAWAMDFTLVSVGNCRSAPCPTIIAARGDITPETPSNFVAFLQHHVGEGRVRNIVLVHSPGGNVLGALRLGQIWRRLGTTAIVAQPVVNSGLEVDRRTGLAPAHCASACVFALMGATRRVVPKGSIVAVHQAHRIYLERDVADNSRLVRRVVGSNTISDALRNYTISMGVHPGIVAIAQNTPPTQMRVLTPSEIRRFRLENAR